ncbi:MAG: isoprenylcysteine carboxylmethyltransferase family protein [Candidatus Omnitrophota bacterium]
MKKRLKVNGFIMALAVLLIAAFPRLFLRPCEPRPWGELAEILGVTFILLGQLFRTSARGYKSEHSREGQLLIQGGPYSLVRNPMYLGILLIGLGVVLMLFEWWVASIFLAIFIVRYILLIFKEEKKLLALFPEEYPSYSSRVPRLLPSLGAMLHKDIAEYLPLRPCWLRREIGTVLAVLLATILLESLGDIKREGVAVYFKESIGIALIILFFAVLYIYLSKRTGDGDKR